jgi:hypothetical protein
VPHAPARAIPRGRVSSLSQTFHHSRCSELGRYRRAGRAVRCVFGSGGRCVSLLHPMRPNGLYFAPDPRGPGVAGRRPVLRCDTFIIGHAVNIARKYPGSAVDLIRLWLLFHLAILWRGGYTGLAGAGLPARVKRRYRKEAALFCCSIFSIIAFKV